MRRLREEERGIALPVAVAVLAIMLLLVSVAVAYSVRSVNKSTQDRGSARALAAADAGLDVAVYRMNKTIIGGQIVNLAGFLNNTILTAGCLNLNVAGLVSAGTGGWCPATPVEYVDPAGGERGERFRYYTELRLDVNLSGGLGVADLTRRVISVGEADGRTARVMGTYTVNLGRVLAVDSLASLFSLKNYKQCSSTGFSDSSPAAGC
jgi:hypothetical protein